MSIPLFQINSQSSMKRHTTDWEWDTIYGGTLSGSFPEPPPFIRWVHLFPSCREWWLLMAQSCSFSGKATSDRMEPGERLYLPLQMGIPHSHGLADLRDKRPVLLLQDGLSLRENIMLQSSPWHQAEARLQMRPHPCFTSFPSLSCFLFSFFPKSIP